MAQTPKNKDPKFRETLLTLRHGLPAPLGKNVTQEEVARGADISITAYQFAESGIVPGDAVLMKLARYFGVTESSLLDGTAADKKQYAVDPPPPKPALDRNGIFGETKRVRVNGREFAVTSHSPPQDNPYLQPMAMLSEILASGDPVLVPAIQANLRAFQTAIHKERQIAEQAQKIKELQDDCEGFKRKNDNLEERLAALERKVSKAHVGECQPQDCDDLVIDPADPGKRAVA